MSAHSTLRATAAIARWLPTAPREAGALTAALAAQFSAELPTLKISLALWQHGAWLLYGATTQAAQSWIATLDPEASPVEDHSDVNGPKHSVLLIPNSDLRLGVAVWGRKLADGVFESITATVELAFSNLAVTHSVGRSSGSKRSAEVAAIKQIAHQLNTTLNLELVLETVLRESIAVTEATHGAVALSHEDGTFQYTVLHGYNDQAAQRLKRYPLAQGQTPADLAIREARAIITNDAIELHTDVPYAFASGLDIPITHQERVVGLITLRALESNVFTPRQREFMSLVADQAAVAIGNAQHVAEQQRQRELLQQRANVLSEVLEVGHLIRADRSLTEMLTDIAYGIVNAVGFRSVVINLRDEANPQFFVRTAFAGVLPDEIERLRQAQPSIDLIARLSHEQWRLSDSYFVPHTAVQEMFGSDLQLLTTSTRSDNRHSIEWHANDLFFTPLRDPSGLLIGFMSVDDPFDRHRPTRRTAEALEIFANLAITAIDNARLYRAAQRRLHEAHIVNQLAQALTAPIGLDELAEVLFSQLNQALNTNSVLLAVYDRNSDVVDYPLIVDRGERKQVAAQQGASGLTAHLLQTKQPLLLNDDIAAQLDALGIVPQGEMCRSFAGTPLIVGNEAVGVLAVQDYDHNHAFKQHELELLQMIALQIASGIEKARLLQQRERQIAQIQTLNNIGKIASSTLVLHDLFIDMYIELSRYRKTDTLLLSVCDPETWSISHMMTIDNGQLHKIEDNRPIHRDSYTDIIMRTGQPLLFRNAPEEEQQHGINTLMIGQGNPALSWAGVPLLNTSVQPFGILSMQSYSAGAYDLRDIDFLTNVAQQIALNIQNAALFKQSQQQVKQLAAETERLELINRVSSWASGRIDLDDLLQRTVTEMARVTNADQARLLLIDRARDIAVCRAEYIDTGATGRLMIPVKGNPAIEWADKHHASMLVSDAVNDPRFTPIHAVLRAENIRDLLIVPLIVKGEVIGTVGLDAKAREHMFSMRDMATCETIANQVATALENSRLWSATQQSVRELTMLYDLSVSLTTMLDLDEILYTVVGAALEIERANISAIVLMDQAERITRFAAMTHSGEDVDVQPFEHHPAILDVMRTATPLIVNDCTESGHPELYAQTQSYVLVPIIAKSQAVGCLIVAAYQPRTWTDREQSLLTILTTQAATAIENAHLFKSEQQKRELADTLRDVAVALTSTLDIQEVLRIILVQLQRFVPYTSATAQMLSDDQQVEMVLRRSSDDLWALETADMLLPECNLPLPLQQVLTTQRPLVVGDTHITYPPLQESAIGTDIRAWLGVPLLHGNHLLGVIELVSNEPYTFTAEMEDLALTFATQAAQAIAHARLFEQIRRFNSELEEKVAERTAALTAEKDRLAAVHAITTTLTASLDIDEIVLKTLELAAGAMGVQRGSVLIRDPMTDQLIYRAVLSETEGLISAAEPFDLPPGNLVQWTLEQQKGVYIGDVRYDERWITIGRQTQEIRSIIAVPLLAADVPLGVLMLNSRKPNYFNDEHLRLLSTIASEVAIAVHNAELYNFINEQATRLAELLQQQREETGKNRAVLESVAEGVLVLDELDTIVLYNRAAKDVLRTGDNVVVGVTLDEIGGVGTTDEERRRALMLYDAINEGVRNARRQNDSWHRIIDLPGQTIDTTFTPVTTPDGERLGVATVLRDITREIESDKAKREFISTVSHELRTPLTSVKGYVDLLLLGTVGAVSDMQKNFLQVIKSNADRLNALVEDLLEISRLENGKVVLNIKPVSMPNMINDIVALLHTETQRKRMELVLDIEPALPMIEADGKRVSQVLTNLLSNAHKYTRDGGTITVRAFQIDNCVQVDVADTGVGIPPDELPKMFSRFFRTNNALKDEVGGTGLGLSIAKSFVELHGGDMWVTSELEVGSTFSFTIPVEHCPPPVDIDAALPAVPALG